MHVQKDDLPFWQEDLKKVVKMPKRKSSSACTTKLPNYSNYDYTDILPEFNEQDRMLETDLPSLVCYNDFEMEGTLNQFTDGRLNDHLYMIFCKRNLKTPQLICKLVMFFVQ